MDAELRKFRTFLFDLDGVLLDTIPDLVLLTNRILEEVDCPSHTTEEIVSYVGNGVRSLIYQALPEDADEKTVDRAVALWNELFYDYYHNTFPFPGIVEVLDRLKDDGCKLGIVSNKLQSGVDLIIDKCLPGYFEVMFGEGVTTPRKPDPTSINLAMQVLDASPDDTVYIGDSPSDIVAAHNAGLFGVAALWGYHEPEDFPTEGFGKPNLSIHSPLEILQLVADCDAD